MRQPANHNDKNEVHRCPAQHVNQRIIIITITIIIISNIIIKQKCAHTEENIHKYTSIVT